VSYGYKDLEIHKQDWHNSRKLKIKFNNKCDTIITWIKTPTLLEWTFTQRLVNHE